MKFDIDHNDQLIEYLHSELGVSPNSINEIQTLTGGVSNRTKLVRLDNGDSWVIKQALSQLRVEGEWHSKPQRILRESAALRWFGQSSTISTPGFIHEDEKEFIIIMEAIEPPFENFKNWLMEGNFSENYIRESGKLLGNIHSESIENMDAIPKEFYDQHYFESLRIHPYYTESQRVLPECRNFLEELKVETNNNAWCLVHGDFSPKNILLKNNSLVLLDHEVIHVGDGCFDMGFFTSHLLSKANHISSLREKYITSVNSFFDGYQNQGKDLHKSIESRAVKHSIACLIARVCGLSKLEYLTQREKSIQQTIALELIKDLPQTFVNFTDRYKILLNEYY